jgi:hypothetical protein
VALVLSRPTPTSLLLGLGMALPGEVLRLWASGHIEKTRSLATGGPYGHTRNPLYLGSALLALGFALASSNPWVVAAVGAYMAAFYPAVMREEAAFLRRRFGAEFEAWERDVPAFLPRLLPGGPRATRFDWGRVRLNREWRTALALPLLGALLYARAVVLP